MRRMTRKRATMPAVPQLPVRNPKLMRQKLTLKLKLHIPTNPTLTRF